jgi:3-oxoacyl-[acyl-carrier-protein] synthase-3
MLRAVVAGVGSYLPAQVRTNADIAQMVETNDAWIVERTGIEQRHIAASDEMTSDLAAAACKQALERAGISASDVDLLLVATATPDETFPSTAAYAQKKIGMTQGAAMDIAAACSGFVYGLHLAKALIATGQAKTILLTGAEIFSRIVDWSDRNTCILFGDGAGAVVLRAEEGKGDTSDRGVLYTRIASDGTHAPLLHTTGGVARTQTAGSVLMNGREVFRHAVSHMSEEVSASLEATGLSADAIRWLVPHQANARIMGAVATRLGVTEDRVIQSVSQHANTSAASIPLAFAQAYDQNLFAKGDLIATPALGAGLTWGTSLLRW